MKIVINNTEFNYDEGCKLLKLKHEECPFEELKDIWNDIVPMSFKEIAQLKNLEQRRVGVLCLGLERLAKEIKPVLIDKQTIEKTTNFYDKNGKHIVQKFNDTYELYEVKGDYFNEGLQSWQKMQNAYFVKCKDTSTDREYFIWVDPASVFATNSGRQPYEYRNDITKVNAIQCIAWTIQTTVKQGNIEKILRQGDCILVKPKERGDELSEPRHLTEKEYRTLLVAES